MRRHHFLLLGFINLLIARSLAHAEESDRRPFYLIRVAIKEENPSGSREQGTLRVLAEPMVATVEGREAVVKVGGAVTVGSEQVDCGLLLRVRAQRAEQGKVRIAGMIERSEVTQQSEGLAVLQSTRAIFERTVVRSEMTKVCLPSSAEGKRWMELTVDDFRGQNPEVLGDVRATRETRAATAESSEAMRQ